MKNINQDKSHILGWGVDADPKNDPTYPMKTHTDHDHDGYTWNRPQQQPVNIELLKTIERPNVSAVFGDSIEPEGFSGKIRRFAFQYGEGRFRHWIPLILADRVQEIEAIIEDIKSGHYPNIFKEKGFPAAWKYNKVNIIKNVALVTLVTYIGIKLLSKSKD
jgi:hypothetical protein